MLFSSGLLSKWGFNDGDAPDDVLEYCESHGLGWRADWHPVLVRLVQQFLVPVLAQDVTLAVMKTNHNPVRAETVNGADVADFWYEGDGPELSPEYVQVPLAEVARAIRELRGDG